MGAVRADLFYWDCLLSKSSQIHEPGLLYTVCGIMYVVTHHERIVGPLSVRAEYFLVHAMRAYFILINYSEHF